MCDADIPQSGPNLGNRHHGSADSFSRAGMDPEQQCHGVHELKAKLIFLMDRAELRFMQPSKTNALDKRSMILIEILLLRKSHVLSFQGKRKMSPEQEACVVLFFDAQEYLGVTEFSVGPCPQDQGTIHAGHPDPCVTSALLYGSLKETPSP